MEQPTEVNTVASDEKTVKIQSNTVSNKSLCLVISNLVRLTEITAQLSTAVGNSTTFEEEWANKYLKFGIAPAQVERALPIAQGLSPQEARQVLAEYIDEYK